MPIDQEFLTILDAARILGLSNRLRLFLVQNMLKLDVGDDEKHKNKDRKRCLTKRALDAGDSAALRPAFFWLRAFSVPKQNPCPPQRQ